MNTPLHEYLEKAANLGSMTETGAEMALRLTPPLAIGAGLGGIKGLMSAPGKDELKLLQAQHVRKQLESALEDLERQKTLKRMREVSGGGAETLRI